MLIIDYYVVDKAINIFYVFFTCPVSAQYDRKAGGRPDVWAVPAHQLPHTSPVPLAHLGMNCSSQSGSVPRFFCIFLIIWIKLIWASD